MKDELKVAIVSLLATMIGVVIGAGVSVWITTQQLSLSYERHELEILQGQITHLQNTLGQISGLTIDVSDENLTSDQIRSRAIDTFLQRARIFLSFSYLFPKEFEDKVIRLSAELNKFIYQAKMHQPIDETAAHSTFTQISVIENEIEKLIRARLRMLQSELDRITTTTE